MMTILTKSALRWMEEHRRRVRLSALLKHDDKMLEDMGLVRGEILAALELPAEINAWTAARNGSKKSFALDCRGGM